MEENDLLRITAKINKEKFPGLDGYDVGDAMYFAVMPREVSIRQKQKFTFVPLVKSLVSICLTRRVELQSENENAKRYFLYSNSYIGRKEHKNTFDKVTGIIDSKAVFSPIKKLSLRNIRNFLKPFQYKKILEKYFPANDAWLYAVLLARAYCDFEFIKRTIKDSKAEILTVFCDVHLIDSLSVQYCNKAGIATATLQHGNLSKGPSYKLSKSKYFLGYGNYTKKIAAESGMDISGFVSCGMPNYIGISLPANLVRNKTGKIGVIFCDYMTIDDDTKILNIAIEYAQKHSLGVVVKLHPACGKENYKDVDWGKIDAVYGKEINISQFMEKIDYALIGASTVFIEYTVALFPCFSFACREDKYEEITWNKFNDLKELEEKTELLLDSPNEFEEKLKNTRSYFTPVDDIAGNYRRFYERY